MIILRAVFYFEDGGRYEFLRDVDFRTFHNLLGNGIIDYYKHNSIDGYRGIYLYYWCFIYYPIWVLPAEIGLYVWDALRLIATLYIAKNLYKITEKKADLIAFFILSSIGYFADAYLNNSNWLLLLLLFLSFIEFKNDRKWLSGILFAIAMYKINVIIFPFVLLISKEIKIKDLLYYVIPFGLLCIPYIIFPEYLSQLLYNWSYVEGGGANDPSILISLYMISWQAFQTAQLMFLGLIVLILVMNINNEQWRNRTRVFLVLFIIILNLTFPIVLWQMG